MASATGSAPFNVAREMRTSAASRSASPTGRKPQSTPSTCGVLP